MCIHLETISLISFPRQCDLATALGLSNGVQYDFGQERFVIGTLTLLRFRPNVFSSPDVSGFRQDYCLFLLFESVGSKHGFTNHSGSSIYISQHLAAFIRFYKCQVFCLQVKAAWSWQSQELVCLWFWCPTLLMILILVPVRMASKWTCFVSCKMFALYFPSFSASRS